MLSLVVVNNLEDDEKEDHLFGLLTNREVVRLEQAQSVYQDWRLRHRIEDGSRFVQELVVRFPQLVVATASTACSGDWGTSGLPFPLSACCLPPHQVLGHHQKK